MASGVSGPERLIGQVMGGYRLTRALGKGATGVVFLGRREDGASGAPDEQPPGEVAIKVLIVPWQLQERERAEFHARFLREARTLGALSHPHVLPLIAYGEDEPTGLNYMVLPYLKGGALQERLASATKPLAPREIAALLDQVASAVDYAHGQGIIHRDIKPGNILLDTHDRAFLSDFSIAGLIEEATSRLTRTGMALGTPMYMAPEALAGQPSTPAVDIYSLGVVARELVAGPRGNPANLAPRLTWPDVPPPAEAAIAKAMERDPAQRFSSAAAFAQAFSQGLDGQWAEGLHSRLTPRVVGPRAHGELAATQADTHTALAQAKRKPRVWLASTLGAIVFVALLAALALKIWWPVTGGSTAATFAPGRLYLYNTAIGHTNSNTHTNSDVAVTLTSLSLDAAQGQTYLVISFQDYDESKGAHLLFKQLTNVYLLDAHGRRFQAAAATPDEIVLVPGQSASVSFAFPSLPARETALDLYFNTDLGALDMSCVRVTPAAATMGCR